MMKALTGHYGISLAQCTMNSLLSSFWMKNIGEITFESFAKTLWALGF